MTGLYMAREFCTADRFESNVAMPPCEKPGGFGCSTRKLIEYLRPNTLSHGRVIISPPRR